MSIGIRKGDKVIVRTGKDKGKTGKVIHVYPKVGRALVEGINMIKRHMRKTQQYPQGGIVQQERPVHLAKLSLIDPTSGKATRIKMLVAADGSKQRVSVKSQAVIG